MTHYIGIDPGASGGIAIWDGNTLSACKCPKNIGDMYAVLEIYCSRGDLGETAILLEKVWSFPSDSHKTAFSFGKNYGSWLAALEIIGAKYKLVTPKTWQKYHEVPKLDKKERKTFCKTFSQNAVDKTEQVFNVTYYTADAIMIAMAVEGLWDGLDFQGT
tara:strand:+ start:475 stop:954 length:480 start_codon:yes stop_codon:yes gene_type:complete